MRDIYKIAMVSPMEESLSLSEAENSNVKMCIQTVWRKQT
jgi:hypothetical protein